MILEENSQDKSSKPYNRIVTSEMCGCGAHLCASKSNAVNLILRFFVPFVTYDELVTSQVYSQQHKQPTNTTTMVMEPLAPPAAWI
jgi:hypothetical protein